MWENHRIILEWKNAKLDHFRRNFFACNNNMKNILF